MRSTLWSEAAHCISGGCRHKNKLSTIECGQYSLEIWWTCCSKTIQSTRCGFHHKYELLTIGCGQRSWGMWWTCNSETALAIPGGSHYKYKLLTVNTWSVFIRDMVYLLVGNSPIGGYREQYKLLTIVWGQHSWETEWNCRSETA